MGKFIAVGLTDILESSGLSGIPAFVGLALLSFLMHVYCQRFRNLVDSRPHFRTNVYATWLSPGICANPLSYCRLIRIAFSAGISFCSTVSWIPATLQTRRETGTYYSLVLPYPLIFLVVWLLMLLAWYLVGLPIGPGIYPRLS